MTGSTTPLLPPFAVVLVAPQIPGNTGNVIRLTANVGADLHLVEPLGFRLDDRDMKRAGLDYHEYAAVRTHADLASCRQLLRGRRWIAFTTRGEQRYSDIAYCPGDVLLFGAETRGLPAEVLACFPPERRARIPLKPGNRSLNLSNAIAVVAYEAWRQCGFPGAG